MQVALQRVLVEGAAQPGAAAAHVRGDVTQGAEALQLVLVEDFLHVEPEDGLCGGSRTGIMFRVPFPGHLGGLYESYCPRREKEATEEHTGNINDPPNLPSIGGHC